MIPICDGCHVRARVRWWHDSKDLWLIFCGHCSDRHAEAMVTTGWMLFEDERVEEMAG